MPKGVKTEEIKIGNGRSALKGTTVRIRYDGYLSHGDQFQKDVVCTIDLSRRDVIAGLRYGIVGMCVGGCRKIRVSPHFAYGEQGVPDVIPPDAVLIFVITLLDVI